MNGDLVAEPPYLQIHINDLTEDCFLAVFSLLTNIREKLRLQVVCKRWMFLIQKSMLYHHTRLTRVEEVYYESEIRNLQNSMHAQDPHDQRLLRYRISLSDIFKPLPNLRVLHIAKPSLLTNCPLYEWNLDEQLQRISLLELRVANDDQVTDRQLSSLIEKCPKLETVQIVNCPTVNGDFLFHIKSNLKNLTLNHCPIDTKKLNDWILNHGHTILSLSIACRSVDIRPILQSINNTCHQIRELNLNNQTG